MCVWYMHVRVVQTNDLYSRTVSLQAHVVTGLSKIVVKIDGGEGGMRGFSVCVCVL